MIFKRGAKAALTAIAAVYLLALKIAARPAPQIMMSTYSFFGHVALEPERRRLQQLDCGESDRDLWTFGSPREQPNRYLVEVWSRVLRVPPSWWVSALIRVGELIPILGPEVVKGSLFDGSNRIDRLPMQLPIRNDEKSTFARQMLKLGIDVAQPYAVLIVRDPAYFGHLVRPLSDGSVRDRDIEDFGPAVHALVASGVQVVRLGHRVTRPLSVDRVGVLDYATSGARTEFLDVLLPVHATLAVSTLTGPDALCIVGRRPVLYVDVAVYAQPFHETGLTWWTPARLCGTGESKAATVSEAFQRGWGWFEGGAEFMENQVSVARSTPDEIAADVKCFVDECRQRSGLHPSVSDIRAMLTREMGPRGVLMHGDVRSSVPSSFIDRHHSLFATK